MTVAGNLKNCCTTQSGIDPSFGFVAQLVKALYRYQISQRFESRWKPESFFLSRLFCNCLGCACVNNLKVFCNTPLLKALFLLVEIRPSPLDLYLHSF